MAVQQSAFPDLTGPDFVKSEEVAEVGEAVLRIHGAIGGVARLHPIAEAVRDDELTILWLLNTKPFNPETDDEDEPEIAGRCVKAPGLWRDVTGYHFAIWARSYFWARMGPEERRALVLHELLHIEVNRDKDGNAKFATRKHDVEDFVDVARHYGPLAGEGARYIRAAALFAGVPEPIGAKRSRLASKLEPNTVATAHAAVDAIVSASGLNEEVRAQSHRDVDAAAAELRTDDCIGSNHVPGCAHFDQPAVSPADDELLPA